MLTGSFARGSSCAVGRTGLTSDNNTHTHAIIMAVAGVMAVMAVMAHRMAAMDPVERTALDAVSSKLSAVQLGYLEDPFAEAFTVRCSEPGYLPRWAGSKLLLLAFGVRQTHAWFLDRREFTVDASSWLVSASERSHASDASHQSRNLGTVCGSG